MRVQITTVSSCCLWSRSPSKPNCNHTECERYFLFWYCWCTQCALSRWVTRKEFIPSHCADPHDLCVLRLETVMRVVLNGHDDDWWRQEYRFIQSLFVYEKVLKSTTALLAWKHQQCTEPYLRRPSSATYRILHKRPTQVEIFNSRHNAVFSEDDWLINHKTLFSF